MSELHSCWSTAVEALLLWWCFNLCLTLSSINSKHRVHFTSCTNLSNPAFKEWNEVNMATKVTKTGWNCNYKHNNPPRQPWWSVSAHWGWGVCPPDKHKRKTWWNCFRNTPDGFHPPTKWRWRDCGRILGSVYPENIVCDETNLTFRKVECKAFRRFKDVFFAI